MKTDISKEEWLSIYTTFCRDCFHFHKNNGDSIAVAFDKAREETMKLRHHPYHPNGEPIDREALAKWNETYSQKVVETLYDYEQNDWLGDLRLCEQCGFPIFEGYYIYANWACCDECAVKFYNGDKERFEQELHEAQDPNNPLWSEVYWSEWGYPIND